MKKIKKGFVGLLAFIIAFYAMANTARAEQPDAFVHAVKERSTIVSFQFDRALRDTYTAKEWLTAENELQFPFDLAVEKFWADRVRHVVPKEALQAVTTESLLRAVKQYTDHFTMYGFYNFPSDYLTFAERFNATGELQQRLDLTEVLLAVYEGEELENEDEVVLEEILLASNFVFEQADEEMRQQILEAVMKKVAMRHMGTDTAEVPSGFLAYITEMKDTDASLWYAYIMEDASNTSAKACLEDYESSFYWPFKD